MARKYDPLADLLARSVADRVALTFEELDRLVGGLPPSAGRHRAWWENEVRGGHVQARSWMGAGYLVDDVRLGQGVVFERAR